MQTCQHSTTQESTSPSSTSTSNSILISIFICQPMNRVALISGVFWHKMVLLKSFKLVVKHFPVYIKTIIAIRCIIWAVVIHLKGSREFLLAHRQLTLLLIVVEKLSHLLLNGCLTIAPRMGLLLLSGVSHVRVLLTLAIIYAVVLLNNLVLLLSIILLPRIILAIFLHHHIIVCDPFSIDTLL